MAKLITKFRFYKNGNGKKVAGYMKYIATREHVEKCDASKQYGKASKSQTDLIQKLLSDFPDSRQSLEYEDYKSNPTVKNATEFISRCIEDNAMTILQEKTYADYIATRPRAEKIGSHGLFTDDDTEIILSKVAQELNKFQGNVFTMIVSLRREDAVRLGFDHAARWQNMLRSHTEEMSEALRIPFTNFRWYAAFHNEGHHPHVHVMMWSADPSQGYLSKKSINALRSSLANDIFKDDLQNEYREQTVIRDTLKDEWKSLLEQLIVSLETSNIENPVLAQKLILLAERLRKTSGKKVYGYLKKDVKDLIDSIVDIMAEDETVAKIYDMWWEKKCEILRTYYQNPPQTKPPLSQNKEFKSLKNDIIREAMKIGSAIKSDEDNHASHADDQEKQHRKKGNSQSNTHGSTQPHKQYSPSAHKVSATAVTGLFRSLGNTFRDKMLPDNSMKIFVDKRQKREEEQKRDAESWYIS